MKDKIILFIIGVLVGSIISTSAFFVYTKLTSECNSNCNNQMPSMANGQNGQPPEMPNESNSQNNSLTSSN